ncbi:hypothetical protein FB45DRAFT_987993 [Roridomyces roridus]|uniref:Glycoside hydrolase 131 catalytic N-terminal domain-containing protein n=1 Tax=Roridomyces roridus TaxID=1738132 RepID=A0AAD7CC78_9AGAR|nr:hypothetical protein FB45DRAFT_987993 [Roridomyces roridus]
MAKLSLFKFLLLLSGAMAKSVIYDGRAPFSMKTSDLDTSVGPFLTAVKGQNESASHYSTLLGHTSLPTPLYNAHLLIPTEQVISIRIDNTSVFVPGGGPPQFGFRRTEFIAQPTGNGSGSTNTTALDAVMESPGVVSTFRFSIKADVERPLNYTHEYQIVFIEPSDGTHVFEVQLGSPFTDPTGPLPTPDAHSFKIRDHALNVLFETLFTPLLWHNFGVTVDWANRTLRVLYSTDGLPLKAVTETMPNPTATLGALGDFHFGVLKLPLVNPNDTPADQSDVVHHGIQEGTEEGLFYSGVFVESE